MSGGMQTSLLPLKAEGLREGQPHLSPWEGERATDPGNHFQSREGQGDQ